MLECPYRFFELDTQYEQIKPLLSVRFEAIFSHKQFINGPEVQELEEKLKKYSEVKFAYATNNGTSSLIISLIASGVSVGDEVITSPLSFGATAMSIALLGATPVFVEIDTETGLIKPEQIKPAITKKTKAIMPVHLYGQVCDMDEINAIAKEYNLSVIEDSCQSFGGTYKNQSSGTLGDMGAISFFPAKPLGSYGSAGAILTNTEELGEKIKKIRNNGQSKRFHYDSLGFNATMNSFQAGVILEKLKLFDKELKLRQEKAKQYDKAFKDHKGSLKLLSLKKDRVSARSYYVLKSLQRDFILNSFKKAGYPLDIHYPSPLFDQAVFKNKCRVVGDPHIVREFSSQILSLPCHAYLKEEHQEKIIQLMREFDAGFRN